MYEWLNRWSLAHPKAWWSIGPIAFGIFAFFAWWAEGESWYGALGTAAVGTAGGVVLALALIRLRQPRQTSSQPRIPQARIWTRSATIGVW